MIECLANPAFLARVAVHFGALADENRLQLLMQLKEAPANVSALTAGTGIAQASVSKHLAILRRAGIVGVQRKGVQAYYFVRDPGIFDLCRMMCENVMRHANEEHAALTGSAPASPRPRTRTRATTP